MVQQLQDLKYFVYDTAVGDVTLVATNRSLKALLLGAKDPLGCRNEENVTLLDAIVELNQYFFGIRQQFTIPLEPIGNAQELLVFKEVEKIPYGHTSTYKQVGDAIGKDEAFVEETLLKNHLPLFIPCHRVLKSENDHGNYVFGPLLKDKLLSMEKEKNRNKKMFRPGHYLNPKA